MKKAKYDASRQARRQRALDRLRIAAPAGNPQDPAYLQYVARKNTERAALQRALTRGA